jgi:hypothetical protein
MNHIELISTLIQAATSVIAIIISVASLVYTTKSIRDANKPYVVAYPEKIKLNDQFFVYLTIKNFGKTGAYIKSVVANPEIDAGKLVTGNNPFSTFSNQLIAPNQSFTSCIWAHLIKELELKTKKFNLTITFSDLNNKIYTEHFSIDIDSIEPLQKLTAISTSATGTEKAIYMAHSENIINRL